MAPPGCEDGDTYQVRRVPGGVSACSCDDLELHSFFSLILLSIGESRRYFGVRTI